METAIVSAHLIISYSISLYFFRKMSRMRLSSSTLSTPVLILDVHIQCLRCCPSKTARMSLISSLLISELMISLMICLLLFSIAYLSWHRFCAALMQRFASVFMAGVTLYRYMVVPFRFFASHGGWVARIVSCGDFGRFPIPDLAGRILG